MKTTLFFLMSLFWLSACSAANLSFMVFLNADNNLHSAGLKDIAEMKAASFNEGTNILVQFDGYYKDDSTRLLIKKGEVTVLEQMGEVDMGDYNELVKFAAWGVQNYPADKYALVIWNHGAGWKLQQHRRGHKGISYDDHSGNHITTKQIGVAMKEIADSLGRNLDIVGNDACLMGMAEVLYEMKDSVNYFVGSEETEPGNGWPYDDILNAITAEATVEEIVTIIVEAYGKSYNDGSQGFESDVTQSAVNLSKLGAITAALDKLVYDLNGLDIAGINAAINKTVSFYYSDYKDLYNLTENLKAQFPELAVEEIQTALNEAIVKNSASGYLSAAKGVSIYLPAKYQYLKTQYKQLAFAEDSQWDEFLDFLLQ